MQNLINFWIQNFIYPESVYMVDHINVLLKKHPKLSYYLLNEDLLRKLTNFNQNSKLSILHQNLLL